MLAGLQEAMVTLPCVLGLGVGWREIATAVWYAATAVHLPTPLRQDLFYKQGER